MLVKWKVLCTFGMLFWSAMCAMDYAFGNIINSGEFSKFPDIVDDDDEQSSTVWRQVVIWGMFSFTASFVICLAMKFWRQHTLKYRQEVVVEEAAAPSNNIIDCSVSVSPLVEKISEVDIKFEPAKCARDRPSLSPNINLLDVVKDFPVTTDSSEMTTRLVEKRCAKLKEEMREMQMNTWKEYSTLNKKLDTVSKEKLEADKQLRMAQKENKQVKQQLEEVLNDRALLIKRLDCATKEIKMNTSAKQITLDKLEEAVACSGQMRNKIMQMTKDHDDLEAKYQLLETKYKQMKEQVRTSVANRLSIQLNKTEGIDTENQMQQSEKDIEKVQNKLLDLEKSLEKMRAKPAPSVKQIELNDVNVESSGDILMQVMRETDESEIDQEKSERVEKFFMENAGDCMEDEENTIVMSCGETAESGDQIAITEQFASIPDEPLDESDLSTNQVSENVVTTMSVPASNSTSTSSSATDNSVLSMEDSESDVMYSPGIVSQSPAFQKFLLKVLESPVV